MKELFALKIKNKVAFICASENENTFNKLVDSAYWNWRGIQPQGKVAELEDFLSGYEKVKLTIQTL